MKGTRGLVILGLLLNRFLGKASGHSMKCKQCQREFQREDWAASISGSIMGDECTDTYYVCPVCNVYTVVTTWDNFTGEETSSVSGPISRAEGDERVKVIRGCAEPWDKKCRCPAHVEYFNRALD